MLRYVFYCTDLQKFYSLALKGGERMYAWGRRNEWMRWRGEGVGERIVGVVGKRRDIGGRMMKKGRND